MKPPRKLPMITTEEGRFACSHALLPTSAAQGRHANSFLSSLSSLEVLVLYCNSVLKTSTCVEHALSMSFSHWLMTKKCSVLYRPADSPNLPRSKVAMFWSWALQVTKIPLATWRDPCERAQRISALMAAFFFSFSLFFLNGGKERGPACVRACVRGETETPEEEEGIIS